MARSSRPGDRRARPRAVRPGRCWRRRRRGAPCRGAARGRPRCARRTAARRRPPRSTGRPGPAAAQTASPACPEMTNPPSRAGATLSGWPSSRLASANAGASSSALRRRRPAPRASTMPADDRRRGRAHPAAVRDPVGAVQPQARAAAPPSARTPPASARTTRWRLVARHASSPSPSTSPRARPSTTSPTRVSAQLEGEAEAVEAGSEVGAGGRHLDGHRSGDERHVRPARPPPPRRPRRRRRRCRRGR